MSDTTTSETRARGGIVMDDRALLRNTILQTVLPPILDVIDSVLMADLENTKLPLSSFQVSASLMPLLLKQKIKNLIYDDLLRINNQMAKNYFQKNDDSIKDGLTLGNTTTNTNGTNL